MRYGHIRRATCLCLGGGLNGSDTHSIGKKIGSSSGDPRACGGNGLRVVENCNEDGDIKPLRTPLLLSVRANLSFPPCCVVMPYSS